MAKCFNHAEKLKRSKKRSEFLSGEFRLAAVLFRLGYQAKRRKEISRLSEEQNLRLSAYAQLHRKVQNRENVVTHT